MECTSTTTTAFITFLLCIFVFFLSLNSTAVEDIIRANETVRDGSVIVSSGGHISSSVLLVLALPQTDINGNLVILNSSNYVVWSSNSSTSVNNPVVHLLDTGNLVIRDENDKDTENYLWQSFHKPGNTFLPGCKLGWNLETGLERYLSSWKSEDDPSLGEYTNRIDRNGYPQLLMRKGSAIHSRAGGPWNGVRFSGTPNFKANPIYRFYFVSNNKELNYYYELLDDSVSTRIVLSPLGSVQRLMETKDFTVYFSC
ncbi:hypothetical protein POM88_011029 [Heracleum sosnowskyi]|uniref:Bulb-type lectin domain-containing protein n=1 Tax=Heracleum sosnowskyi TaxID=360622 RepID=A0AAD8IVI9_9APIA|nr:hypothetical protein POM88_011029 [Heracleum sosnowskyi]